MSVNDQAGAPLPIYPVILAGGAADGLWPLSRDRFPWQFRKNGSGDSPMQNLLRWCEESADLAAPTVMCHFDYRFIVSEQCAEKRILPYGIVLEPERRGSGPSALAAAFMLALREPEALLLFMPSDLPLLEGAPLHSALAAARPVAEDGRIVLLADRAGRRGDLELSPAEALDGEEAVFALAEEADEGDAGQRWPYAGLALARAQTVVEACRAHFPDLAVQMEQAVRTGGVDLAFYRLGKTAYTAARSRRMSDLLLSAEGQVAVAPCTLGLRRNRDWGDAVQASAHNGQGNSFDGDIVAVDVKNSYLRSEDRLVGAIGLDDVMVVDTPDALLVAARDRLKDMPKLLDALRRRRRIELEEHQTAFRPWGQIAALGAGDHYDIKMLTLRPGAAIALQLHHHRAKHWVVLAGTARVRRGERRLLLSPNQSVFIPIGMPHAVANPGKLPLIMVQVQSGDYFGRDDVVRLEEPYRAVEEANATPPPVPAPEEEADGRDEVQEPAES